MMMMCAVLCSALLCHCVHAISYFKSSFTRLVVNPFEAFCITVASSSAVADHIATEHRHTFPLVQQA